MSFDVATRIQENPVEAVAVVTAIGLIGVVIFQSRKVRQLELELELAKYRAELYRTPDYHRLDRHQKRKLEKFVK